MNTADKLTLYQRRIREVYPDLPIGRSRLEGDGQNNDIVIVDERLIFRFPRYDDGITRLVREVTILNHVRRYVTLPVPDPIYSSYDDKVVGRAFIGYPMIPGEPLRRELLAAIHDEDTLQTLATQLATFLKHAHSAPLDELLPGAAACQPLARWESLYERIRLKLFPYMRPDARSWAVRHFEGFLSDRRNQDIAPTLVHGDFGASNILYDATKRTITGVIDFSSAGIDDPAVDFAAASTIGADFLQRFYATYPEIQGMLARAEFYKGTFALQEALFGLENGDEEAFRAGIADVAL